CAPAHVRHPSARRWGRPACRPGAAGSCRPGDHPAIHSCQQAAASCRVRSNAPSCLGRPWNPTTTRQPSPSSGRSTRRPTPATPANDRHRTPTDVEVAAELGMTEGELHGVFNQISFVGLVALDEMLSVGGERGESTTLGDTIPDKGEGPVAAFEVEEMKQIL